jgi:hypothetical protein
MLAFALPMVLDWATAPQDDPLWPHVLALDVLVWSVTAAVPLATGALHAAQQERL